MSGASYNSPIDGVITHWGVNKVGTGVDSNLGPDRRQRDELRQLDRSQRCGPIIIAQQNVVNESGRERLAIKAGEGIGFATGGGGGGALCNTLDPGDTVGYSNTFFGPGGSYAESIATAYRIPVFATVEADVDKDGYGDDTQDKCPQSAALQNPCPVLAISQQLAAAKGAIAITAAASVDTSLTATAKVKVPKLGQKKAATVTFASKATAFSAGQIKSIKLKLPSRVKDALAATKKSKKLKFTVTLAGSGLSNTASSVKSISLPGTQK